MDKIILISGSNRKGNTEYILTKLKEQLTNSELILLKDKKIAYCQGCLACHHKNRCVINDDINAIIDKLIESDLIIFGVPNYFDNVSGLFKNFIDRLHPLYKSKELENKKVIFIFVGGGEVLGTEETLQQSIKGFAKYLGLNVENIFSFKALNINDIKMQEVKIEEIIKIIKSKNLKNGIGV